MVNPYAKFQTAFRYLRTFSITATFVLLVVTMTGCVSQKPLPYNHSPARAAAANAPKLTVVPAASVRTERGDIDKTLALPSCLDPVIVKEMEGSGLFSLVELATDDVAPTGITLESKLANMQWEVPHYDRLLGTMFAVSFCTGGIGAVVYGCTDTDVLGHATVHFRLTDSSNSSVLLDRDYSGDFKVRKIKFSCDTPDTYREVAAGAFKSVMDQFEADVKKLSF